MELREKLVQRGYRGRMVDNAITKVKQLKREDILQRVTREDNNLGRVRAVLRFDRRMPNVSDIMKKNWKTMVNDDKRLLKVFPQPPMVCFTRGKNLREELC